MKPFLIVSEFMPVGNLWEYLEKKKPNWRLKVKVRSVINPSSTKAKTKTSHILDRPGRCYW